MLTVFAVAGVAYFGKRGAAPLASLPAKSILIGALYVVIAALANAIGLVIARKALQEADIVWGTLLRMAPALLFLGALRWAHHGRSSLRVPRRSRQQVGALILASFFGTFVGVLLHVER